LLRYCAKACWSSGYTSALADLLGGRPRGRNEELTGFHQDVAASVQLVLEEILLDKMRYLHERTGLASLCYAGGVALNCVANRVIRERGPFGECSSSPRPVTRAARSVLR
jgi:carbamoyltransferase